MALLGNRTLPAAATAVPASPAPPPSDSKPFEVPQQADQATAPAAVPIVVPVAAAASESTTTTLDIVEAAPEEAQSKVAQAVMQASKANGLDNADTAATAAAVSAASEAAKASTPAAQADSLSKVAEAAASMGLSDAQVQDSAVNAVLVQGQCDLTRKRMGCTVCCARLRPGTTCPRSQAFRLHSDLPIRTIGAIYLTPGKQLLRQTLPRSLQPLLKRKLPLSWQRRETRASLFSSRLWLLQRLGRLALQPQCSEGLCCAALPGVNQ